MSDLSAVQKVILEGIEDEIKQIVHRKYEYDIRETDYAREATKFVEWLVDRYTKDSK